VRFLSLLTLTLLTSFIHYSTNLNSPAMSTYAAPAAAAQPAYSPTPNYATGYGANGYASTSTGYNAQTANAAAASAAAARAAALPTPRFGGYNAATAAGGGQWQSQRIEEHPIKFRPSPFYTVEKSLTSVTPLPKAPQGDKKNVACTFALTEAQRTLLSKARCVLFFFPFFLPTSNPTLPSLSSPFAVPTQQVNNTKSASSALPTRTGTSPAPPPTSFRHRSSSLRRPRSSSTVRSFPLTSRGSRSSRGRLLPLI
jgi:hypothetical protein